MNAKLFFLTKLLLVITGTCLLAACSSAPPHMATNIEAASFLNPNIYNQPSPVVVTIYQLKSATAFQQANFFALSNDAASLLGPDLLDKRDIEIRPQQKQALRITLAPNTSFIGVVAAFRNPDTAQWRQVVPVKAGKNIDLKINLASQSFTLNAD